MAQFSVSDQAYKSNNDDMHETTIIVDKDGFVYDSDNPMHVTLGSDSITITGNVNVGTTVEIANDEGNPIPINGTVEATQSGTWNVDISSIPEVDIKNDIGNPISTTIISDGDIVTTVNRFPVDITNQTITVDTIIDDVNVTQGTDPWIVDGTVALDAATLSALENINATITGDVNVTQGTDPWVVSGNINSTIIGSSAVGLNKPFYLEVAQGIISGYSFNHKFGAAPNMSIDTTGSVWDINDTIYPWAALDTPAVVNIERNDAADNGLIVTVQGLDSNWNVVQENITITGADQVGTTLFRRVNRAFVTDTGTSNVGDIDIEAGAAGGTTVARITAGLGQTLMGVYTIPAGKTAYLLKGNASAENEKDASGFMFVRYFEQTTFRVGHTFEFSGTGGAYNYEFIIPLPIPEKSDIDIRVTTRAKSGRYTVSFDVLLVDNI